MVTALDTRLDNPPRSWRRCLSLWKWFETLWFLIHFGFSKGTSSFCVFSSLTPFPFSNPPAPALPAPIDPVISPSRMSSFFLWHSYPLPAAWYSEVGIRAPSRIHQLQSECRTMARRNEGIRKGEGKAGERAGRWLVYILPGRKPLAVWDREDESKDRQNKTISFPWDHVILIAFQISIWSGTNSSVSILHSSKPKRVNE